MQINNSQVICIGELLIDFFCTEIDTSLMDGRSFEKQAGGAPANVSATIVKLGGNAAFVGKVGDDPFGHFLKQTLLELRVDTSMLILDEFHSTTMAFVSLDKNGERDFVFHRGADAFLKDEDIKEDMLDQSSILHFGSATALLQEPFRKTYLNTIKKAKAAEKFISFDPNYRADLWKGKEQDFIQQVKECLAYSDFVKVSEEELMLITKNEEFEQAVKELHEMGVRLVSVTLGKKGTFISNGSQTRMVPSVAVNSIDSTGAGDAFVGAMLFNVAQKYNREAIFKDFNSFVEITTFSNKVGALVCTKLGAIASIPTIEEVNSI